MSTNLLGRLLVTSAAASTTLALAACVDGAGGDFAPTVISTIPPTQTPPPPAPAQSPAIFPNITASTSFAVLGLAAHSPDDPLSLLVGGGFSVKFDAASNAYLIGIAGQTPGTFVATSENSVKWYGTIQGSTFGSVQAPSLASIFKPSASNPDFQLAYTSYGSVGGYYNLPVAFFAFGSATPGSGIPLSGSATYDAYVDGKSSGPSYASIGGTATLQFDFGAGTLAGHFDPVLITQTRTSLGSYNFINTMYGAGKTNFSGQLSLSGSGTLGAFDGQFTGPAAQELMARWSAPYLVPGTQQSAQMFGVWVGKKH